MKKVISLILVIAMIASLAVVVSAHAYGNQNAYNFVEHGNVVGTDTIHAFDSTRPWIYTTDWMQIGSLDAAGNWISAYDEFHGNWCAFMSVWGGQEWATQAVQASAEMVKVLDITEGTEEKWATHENAITADEMAEAAADVAEVKHLTVFRQRTVVAPEDGEIELSVKNWQTGKKNRTVVLFKGVDDEAWTIVAVSELGEKVVDAVLPGSGAYVVAMSW